VDWRALMAADKLTEKQLKQAEKIRWEHIGAIEDESCVVWCCWYKACADCMWHCSKLAGSVHWA